MLIPYKKSVIYFTIFLFVVLVQGCETQTVRITRQDQDVSDDPDQGRSKHLKTIRLVHQAAVWPNFKTPGEVIASKLTFGMAEDWSAGKKLIHKFKIEDPSRQVKEKFLVQLNKKPRVAIFNNENKPLAHGEGSIEKLKAKYKTGLVLKFDAYWWEIWYYPTSFSHYQMWFQTGAELVRLNDLKILWKGHCRADQDDPETAPTLDELTADNSKILQQWVDNATTQCSAQLVEDFLANFKM